MCLITGATTLLPEIYVKGHADTSRGAYLRTAFMTASIYNVF